MTEDDSCNEEEIFGMPFQGAGLWVCLTEGGALGYYGSAFQAAVSKCPNCRPGVADPWC